MNPIDLYEKAQIKIYEKLASTETPGDMASKYYKEQISLLKGQLLSLIVAILSEFLRLDSFDSEETGTMTYIAGDKAIQFEYSFKGLLEFIKYSRNFEGKGEIKMRNLGFLSIAVIIIFIAGLMTYVGVESISIVTNVVEQRNAESLLLQK